MLDAEKSPRTVQHCFAIFRQIWNTARNNDIISCDSPTRKVKIPRFDNKRERFLTQFEANELLKEIRASSKQTYNIALLSLHTGARAKEIFTLTWGLVNFDNDSISIRDSKGGSRHIYLTDATKAMLTGLYQGQPNTELVFKDRNGKQIKIISKTFTRTVNTLGLNNNGTDRRDKVTFHTCRHSFASWHVQNGTDLYTVKELLGHSTIQLTERYSHLRPDGLKKAASTLEKYFNNHGEDKKIVNLNTKG